MSIKTASGEQTKFVDKVLDIVRTEYGMKKCYIIELATLDYLKKNYPEIVKRVTNEQTNSNNNILHEGVVESFDENEGEKKNEVDKKN